MGKPIVPIVNDLILPIVIIVWYATHYLGAYNIFTSLPVKVIWSIFVGIFRTQTVCAQVSVAFNVLSPGPYYPIPLVGPILVGIVQGSLGAFFPFDKGLSPITGGTPWPMQGAFITAFFYHILVHDTNGFVGITLRSIVGTYSEPTIRIALVTLQVTTLLAHALFNAEANLFTPFHKFFYLVFQVDGPTSSNKPGTVGWDYITRLNLERLIELGRILIVVAVVGVHIYLTQSPSILPPGQRLIVGNTLGTCQMLNPLQPACKPFLLTVEADPLKTGSYRLASYSGTVLPTSAAVEAQLESSLGSPVSQHKTIDPVWALSLSSATADGKANKKKAAAVEVTVATTATIGVDVDANGTLRLVSSDGSTQQETVLWTSVSVCQPLSAGESPASLLVQVPALSVNPVTGAGFVSCPDGTSAPL